MVLFGLANAREKKFLETRKQLGRNVTYFQRKGKRMFLGTNTDETSVLYGGSEGFKVYDVKTLRPLIERELPHEVTFINTYARSSLFIFTGPDKKTLTFWEDSKRKKLADIVFSRPVMNAVFSNKEILVSTLEKVYIYSISDLGYLKSFGTTQNPYGSISSNSDRTESVLAFPGLNQGYVHVLKNGLSLYIKAHLSTLRKIALNREGTLLATCSEKGTTIRVFDTKTGEKVANFQRGATEAVINHISWSKDSSVLCVSSSRGTTHIFSLEKKAESSLLGYLPGSLGNYATSLAPLSSTKFLHPKGISVFCGETTKHFSSDGYVTEFGQECFEMNRLEGFE
ncbi:WD-repeat containing protein [Tunisvirus fontaine2]|uniref:WD-repeat containing protein n=1 Tax=Tunisvirus fontaine2 TaxID=1421067 RepID=V9SEH1_9VIRU|nr:WD-repeat containing protein [Tunisvirus fontaine2]AHC55115.1 WD-repeat containing protein [Tunisvirus fontaine2]